MRQKNKIQNVDVFLFYADQLPYPLNTIVLVSFFFGNSVRGLYLSGSQLYQRKSIQTSTWKTLLLQKVPFNTSLVSP
jgi:hypothetical protein